jgi:hypothetical protein
LVSQDMTEARSSGFDFSIKTKSQRTRLFY